MSKKPSFESTAYKLFDMLLDLDIIHLDVRGASGFTILGKYIPKDKLAKRYSQVVGSLYDIPLPKKYQRIDAIARPRVTPPLSDLKTLKAHQVLVYASSLSAEHSSPSAKRALKLGADPAILAAGLPGMAAQCYAIPVRDKHGKPLPSESISESLAELVKHAKKNKRLHFLVPELTRELGMLNLFESTKLMLPLESVRNIYLPTRILGYMYDNWGKF